MIAISPGQTKRDGFRPLLTDFIDLNHKLVILADAIDWDYFQSEFEKRYADRGQPAMAIRLMVSCLPEKHLYTHCDGTLAAGWIWTPYKPCFCGEASFRLSFRCDSSDFVHFRGRISKQVLPDTTAGENKTPCPTDAKLAVKVTRSCNRIAKAEGVDERQSYLHGANSSQNNVMLAAAGWI